MKYIRLVAVGRTSLAVLLFWTLVTCQMSAQSQAMNESLSAWKAAVVHLECGADSISWREQRRLDAELFEKLQRKEFSAEEFTKRRIHPSRDIRMRGTAVYVRDGDDRYLVTARHVICNEKETAEDLKERLKIYDSFPKEMQEELKKRELHRFEPRIYDIIFRVASLDEVQKQTPDPKFVTNIGNMEQNGNTRVCFSDIRLDLAVIALTGHGVTNDGNFSRFVEDLDNSGHRPIPLSTLFSGEVFEGTEVATVGYPASVSTLGELSLDAANANWRSSGVALPTFSFGRVAMYHKTLPFLWCDLTIYPGNSGGPLFSGDKWIGIISAQATVPLDATPQVTQRVPFARVISARHIVELINHQRAKSRAKQPLWAEEMEQKRKTDQRNLGPTPSAF